MLSTERPQLARQPPWPSSFPNRSETRPPRGRFSWRKTRLTAREDDVDHLTAWRGVRPGSSAPGAIEFSRREADHLTRVEVHENGSRAVVGWVLFACPLLGVGVALDAGLTGWVPVNGAFLALLFGVPAVLTVLTSALAHLSIDATFALATGSATIAGAWLVMIVGLMFSVTPN